MPEITVGSATIPYVKRGTGPGLLLVHGTGANAEITWGHSIDRFADARTVLAPDLSGSDKVSDDGGELTMELLVEQLRAVVADAGGEPVDVVGFSLGGAIAAAFAGTHPELVNRLVVISSLAHAEDEHLRNLLIIWRRTASDPEAFGRVSTLAAFSPGFLNMLGSEQVDGLVTNVQPTDETLRQMDLLGRLDVRPQLARIAAPTLVIGSTLDGTVPIARSQELHELIAGSDYAELESGHVVLFEQGDAVIAKVRAHLGI